MLLFAPAGVFAGLLDSSPAFAAGLESERGRDCAQAQDLLDASRLELETLRAMHPSAGGGRHRAIGQAIANISFWRGIVSAQLGADVCSEIRAPGEHGDGERVQRDEESLANAMRAGASIAPLRLYAPNVQVRTPPESPMPPIPYTGM
jgi:hypothetical protein